MSTPQELVGRHETAAACVDATLDAVEVARCEGPVCVVLDRYGHLFPEHDEALVAALDLGANRSNRPA